MNTERRTGFSSTPRARIRKSKGHVLHSHRRGHTRSTNFSRHYIHASFNHHSQCDKRRTDSEEPPLKSQGQLSSRTPLDIPHGNVVATCYRPLLTILSGDVPLVTNTFAKLSLRIGSIEPSRVSCSSRRAQGLLSSPPQRGFPQEASHRQGSRNFIPVLIVLNPSRPVPMQVVLEPQNFLRPARMSV